MVTTYNTGSLRYTLGTKRISCIGAYTYIELSHGKLGLDAPGVRQHRLGFILASLVGRIYPSMVPTGQEIVTL